MIIGHRSKWVHAAGTQSGTIEFGPFIQANTIAKSSLSRYGGRGGADLGIIEVTSVGGGTETFSQPVLPPEIARTQMTRITFRWKVEDGNATFVASLFFVDHPVG